MLKASIIKKQENQKVAKTAQPNLPKQFEFFFEKEEDRSRRLCHRPWVKLCTLLFEVTFTFGKM